MNTPSLTFKIEDGNDLTAKFDRAETTLGRADDNIIVIPNSWISSHHARFLKHPDGSVEVIDLDSHNGIVVNGDPTKRCTLRHGDNLKFGLLEAEFSSPSPAVTPRQPDAIAPEKLRAEAAIREMNIALKALRAELADLQSSKSQQASDAKELSQEVAKLKQSRTAISGEIETLIARRKEFERENHQAADQTRKKIETEVTQLDERKRLAADDLDAIQLEVNKLIAQREILKAEADVQAEILAAAGNAESQHNTRQQELSAIESTIQTEDQKRKALQAEITQLAEQKQATSAKIQPLQFEVDQLTARSESLRSEVGEAELLHKARQKELSEIESQIRTATKRRNSLLEEAKRLAEDRGRTTESLGALQLETSQLTTMRDGLKSETELLESGITSLKTTQQTLVAEVSRLKSSRQESQSEITHLEHSRDNLLSEVATLQSELASTRARTPVPTADARNPGDFPTLQTQHEKLRDEITSCQQQLADAKSQLNDTWEQFTALSEERDALSATLKQDKIRSSIASAFDSDDDSPEHDRKFTQISQDPTISESPEPLAMFRK